MLHVSVDCAQGERGRRGGTDLSQSPVSIRRFLIAFIVSSSTWGAARAMLGGAMADELCRDEVQRQATQKQYVGACGVS
jgi:hypothetical protein